jgi:hypothetical protein
MFIVLVELVVLVVLSVALGEGTEWILNAWDVQLARAWDYILPAIYFLILFIMGWGGSSKPKNPDNDDLFPGV